MRYVLVTIPLFFVVILVLYLFTPDFSKRTQASAFIPGDAVVTFTQFDLVKRLDEFAESPLGQALDGINVTKIVDKLQLDSEIQGKITKSKSLFQALRESRLFNLLFGQEVTLALFAFEPLPHKSFNEQVLENILIIARPKNSARIMEFVGRLLSDSSAFIETRYGGHVIARYQLNDEVRLAGAKVEDLLLLSLDERVLRRGLDLYDTPGGALASEEAYQKTRKLFLNADFFGYTNLIDLPNYLVAFGDPYIQAEYLKVALNTTVLHHYRSCFFGLWRKDDKIVSKTVLRKNLSGPPTAKTAAEKIAALSPHSLTRVSPDTIYYYWTDEFEAQPLLDIIKENRLEQQARTGKDNYAEIEAVAGMQIPDMLALVENDITIAAKNIRENQLVPIPLLLVAAEIKDIPLLQSSLEKLIRHYEIPVHRQSVQDVETITWGGIIGMGTIQPTIAYTENRLLLSTNREQIRDYIELQHNEKSLAQSGLFREVGEGLLEENDAISFLNFSEISALLRELVSWGGTMVAIQDRELAQKSKVLIDELINPILEGLAMYRASGVRKNTKNNTVVIESTTLLGNGK